MHINISEKSGHNGHYLQEFFKFLYMTRWRDIERPFSFQGSGGTTTGHLDKTQPGSCCFYQIRVSADTSSCEICAAPVDRIPPVCVRFEFIKFTFSTTRYGFITSKDIEQPLFCKEFTELRQQLIPARNISNPNDCVILRQQLYTCQDLKGIL